MLARAEGVRRRNGHRRNFGAETSGESVTQPGWDFEEGLAAKPERVALCRWR